MSEPQQSDLTYNINLGSESFILAKALNKFPTECPVTIIGNCD